MSRSRERRRAPGRDRREGGTGGRPVVPGYVVGSPLGFGATGAVWSATAGGRGQVPQGRRCALVVVPTSDDERGAALRQRLTRLVGVGSPHLIEILEVVPVPGGCAVISERVDGPSLAALKVSRPPLTIGEAAVVVVTLAGALEELHRRGVVHGDVSPANVLVRPDGSPVLVDLAADVPFEAGTPGFRAPERTAGAPATAASDVWSVAATALWLVAPRDREDLAAALGPVLAPDPELRCDARALATRGAALDPAAGLDLPGATSLARGRLRADHDLDQTRHVGRRVRRASDGAGSRGFSWRPGRSGRRRRRRRVAARSAAWVPALALLGATLVGAGLAAAVDAMHAGASGRRGEVLSATTAGASEEERATPDVPGTDPAGAVAGLIRARDEALVASDARALSSVSLPGSLARSADLRLLDALRTAGVRLRGVSTRVVGLEVVSQGDARARVAVVTVQAPYTRSGPDGVRAVPAQPERCVVLDLGRRGEGWRVNRIETCPGGADGT